jgi:hypothetical protein
MEVFGLGSLSDLPSMREIEEYLSSSTATPLDAGRPGLELPLPFPDPDVEAHIRKAGESAGGEADPAGDEGGAIEVGPTDGGSPAADVPEGDPDAR